MAESPKGSTPGVIKADWLIDCTGWPCRGDLDVEREFALSRKLVNTRRLDHILEDKPRPGIQLGMKRGQFCVRDKDPVVFRSAGEFICCFRYDRVRGSHPVQKCNMP